MKLEEGSMKLVVKIVFIITSLVWAEKAGEAYILWGGEAALLPLAASAGFAVAALMLDRVEC